MDSIKSMVGLGDDGGGGGSSPSSDSRGGGVLSQAWNAVSDGASQVWDAASSTASSAVGAVGDGASAAWNAVSDTASSAASAVGSGASSLMSTVSDDASAAWNAVSDGASSAYNKVFGPKEPDAPISVPVSDTPLDDEGHTRDQADWIKNHPEEVQKNLDAQKAAAAQKEDEDFRKLHYGKSKAEWDQAGHDVGAKDAGFDNAQHMQDYSKATADFQAAWDKLNKIQDSDEREKMRQQMNIPKSQDEYLRQQHIPPRGTPAY